MKKIPGTLVVGQEKTWFFPVGAMEKMDETSPVSVDAAADLIVDHADGDVRHRFVMVGEKAKDVGLKTEPLLSGRDTKGSAVDDAIRFVTPHEFLLLNGWEGPYDEETALGTVEFWKSPDWAEDEHQATDDAIRMTFERNERKAKRKAKP